MFRLTLGKKLLLAFILSGLLPALGVGLFSAWQSQKALEQKTLEKFEAVQQLKVHSIENLFHDFRNHANTLSIGKDIKSAYFDLKKYHDDMETPPDGPYDVDTQAYQQLYERHSPFFTEFIKTFHFYDFFLICAEHGHVMLTVKKEADIGTNLVHGPLKNEGLARLWRKAVDTHKTVMEDFSPYSPSHDAQAAFIGGPVFSYNGDLLGVAALQISSETVNAVAQQRAGMGKSGETYLVGRRDGLTAYRSDRIVKDGSIGEARSDEFIQAALNGASGTGIKTGSTGEKEIVRYDPLDIAGLNWCIITTAATDEMFAASRRLRIVIGITAVVSFAAVILLALLVIRSIARPINRSIDALSEASEQLSVSSFQLSSGSQQLSEGASQQAASIQETASSLEEMSSMIRQNADNAGHASGMVRQTGQVIRESDASMKTLTEAMQDISRTSEETFKIVKTIDEIAFQTNLLALNAAVEAARAGETGAGFAVVADEVRNLAMRAGEAARNTAGLIEGIVKKIHDGNALVNQTNASFRNVTEARAKIEGLIAEIAAASADQAQGVEQINKAIAELDKLTQSNAAGAEQSAGISEEMTNQAGQIKQIAGILTAMVKGGGKDIRTPREPVKQVATKDKSGKPLPDAKTAPPRALDRPDTGKTDARRMIPLDDDDFMDF